MVTGQQPADPCTGRVARPKATRKRVARPAGTPVRPRDMGYSCTRDMGGASGEEKGLDDDALAILKDCVHLTELDVRSTRVTEKGLEIFRGRSNFTSLGLAYLRVTD